MLAGVGGDDAARGAKDVVDGPVLVVPDDVVPDDVIGVVNLEVERVLVSEDEEAEALVEVNEGRRLVVECEVLRVVLVELELWYARMEDEVELQYLLCDVG